MPSFSSCVFISEFRGDFLGNRNRQIEPFSVDRGKGMWRAPDSISILKITAQNVETAQSIQFNKLFTNIEQLCNQHKT